MSEKLFKRTLGVDYSEVVFSGLAEVVVIHRQRAEEEVRKKVHGKEDKRLRVRMEDGAEAVDVLLDGFFWALRSIIGQSQLGSKWTK